MTAPSQAVERFSADGVTHYAKPKEWFVRATDYDALTARVRELEGAREWRPIESAPMEPDSRVTFETRAYIVTDGTTVGVCEFARGGGHIGSPWAQWSEYGGIEPKRITHWQPLPEPPKATP